MKKLLNFRYLTLLTFMVVAGAAVYINNRFKQPPMDEMTISIKNVDENRAVSPQDWSKVQSMLNSNDPDLQVRGFSIVQGTLVKEQVSFGIARAEALRNSPDEFVRVGAMTTLYALKASTASEVIKAGLNDNSAYVKQIALAIQMKRAK